MRLLPLGILMLMYTLCGFADSGTAPAGGSLSLSAEHLRQVLEAAGRVELVPLRQSMLADTLKKEAVLQLENLEEGQLGWYNMLQDAEAPDLGRTPDRTVIDSLLQVAVARGWASEPQTALPRIQQDCGQAIEEALLKLLESYRNNPWDGDVLDLLVEGYARLSDVYRSADVLDQCMTLFGHVIQQNLQSYRARFQMARVLIRQERKREALQQLYQAEDIFLHAVSRSTRGDGTPREAGFSGIPALGKGDADDLVRSQYATLLTEIFKSERDAGLGDNALHTLERLALYDKVDVEERSNYRQALGWGGTPESRLAYRKGEEAETQEDFQLAAELYGQALQGVNTNAERQKVLYALAFVTTFKLNRVVDGIPLFRQMVAQAPLVDGSGVPISKEARERLENFGSALYGYARLLDANGRSQEALDLYEDLCRTPNPNQGEALWYSAELIRSSRPEDAQSRLERLEAMLKREDWTLPTKAEERQNLRRSTFISLMGIHSKQGRTTEADHYHRLATQETGS